MLSIIVAVANNNVIGKDNKLIWHLPEDLKRFKDITNGKTIIMGRKTFESLGKVLPNRFHVVLTQNRNYQFQDARVKIVYSVEELSTYVKSKEEYFVIGGEKIYKMLMPLSQKMYITRIYENFEGDTFFPDINEEEWKLTKKEKGITNTENPYKYEYIDYLKK